MSIRSRRPLSPHLQVYRLPFTALLSIGHRITGAALVGGLVILAATLVAAAAGPQTYAKLQPWLRSWFGQLVLIGFTFALYLHLCNGIRHLFWDAGYGFDLATTRSSGIAIVLMTIILTATTWLIAWSVGG